MCRLYFILILFIFQHSYAQDSLLITEMMQRISALQVNPTSVSIKGLFPSYITNNKRFKQGKNDNNLFFTALTDYTLNNLHAKGLIKGTVSDSIHARAAAAYPYFKNKNGWLTYNFWRTDSAYIFPFTWWIHRIKKNSALPDDMDDTVLGLLAQDTDSLTASVVHKQMQDFINNNPRNAKAVNKDYKRYPAYSVWYGKHFPVVFDVCVLSNVLNFVQHYNLPWSAADSASLQVITHAITTGDVVKRPLSVAPYYGNTAVILYHVARLMNNKPIPQLEHLKTQLLKVAWYQFENSKNNFEKVILCTAIMRLGYVPPQLKITDIRKIEENDLPFFNGNIPSYFPRYLKAFFTRKGWLIFYHYCPAYNDALLVEYLALKRNLNR